MLVYFKRCDSASNDFGKELYEYSLDKFEDGFDGEIEIPDMLTDNEVDTLICHKVCDPASIEEMLKNEIGRVSSLMEELKRSRVFKSVSSEIKYINMSVSIVNKGSFNDERLISSLKINVDDIDGKSLVWTDLYHNKKDGNKIKIAPVYLENNELYFLEDNGDKISVIKKMSFSKYYSDNFDNSHIIATEIYCSRR